MVSVIIPIYNVETYLSKCLDSILGQTFSDLEIIIVNDGSMVQLTNLASFVKNMPKKTKESNIFIRRMKVFPVPKYKFAKSHWRLYTDGGW